MRTKKAKLRTWAATSVAVLALAAGAAGVAGAATNGSSTPQTATAAASTSAPANPATLSHGPGETLLTGTTAEKVTAAAKAAVPGGTIIRVETDSGGAAYEAHVQKADGSTVTVKLDASFNVTATQDGFGAGPGGTHPYDSPRARGRGLVPERRGAAAERRRQCGRQAARRTVKVVSCARVSPVAIVDSPDTSSSWTSKTSTAQPILGFSRTPDRWRPATPPTTRSPRPTRSPGGVSGTSRMGPSSAG